MNAVAQQLNVTNFPPISASAAELLADLQARLDAETFVIASRRDVLLAAVSRVPEITDDNISGKVADFVQQMKEHVKTATAWKDDAKRPVLTLDKAIMERHKVLVLTVEAATTLLQKRQTAYLVQKEAREIAARQEAERIAREVAAEAERVAQAFAAAAQTDAELEVAIVAEEVAVTAAAEADAAQAATQVKPLEMTRITGAMGSMTGLVKPWVFRPDSINMQTIDLEALRPYLAPDDLHKALRAAIKAGRREIKGVVIEQQAKAR